MIILGYCAGLRLGEIVGLKLKDINLANGTIEIIDLETKRKALEQVDPKLRPNKPPGWKQDADLLAWLDSL